MMLSAAFACSGLEAIVTIDPAPIINEESALFDHSLRLSMVSSLSAKRCDECWLHRRDDDENIKSALEDDVFTDNCVFGFNDADDRTKASDEAKNEERRKIQQDFMVILCVLQALMI
jgi:hypothetical protein